MDFSLLLTALLPIVAAALTSTAMNVLKKVSAFVDAQAPVVKQIIVVVLAFAATQIAGVLGIVLSPDLLGWEGDTVNTLITALLSFGLYNIFPKKDSTA